MYVIDLNVHIAYLLKDSFEKDDLTRKYMDFYDTIPLSERVVSDFILGEFETFMIRVSPSRFKLNPHDKRNLKEFTFRYIQQLMNDCTIVVPEIQAVQRARDVYFEHANNTYISFVDCLLLATAERYQYTLFTKDTRLNAVAEKLGIATYRPQ